MFKVIKGIKLVVGIFIFSLFFNVICFLQAFGDAASDYGFDIMETFDELQDWTPSPTGGTDTNQDNMPKKVDGTDSMWNVFDYWSKNAVLEPSIAEHGAANVFGGTGKSLIMDLKPGSGRKKGPSRFAVYFGSSTDGVSDPLSTSGLPGSGYNEIYVFYMVKFPENAFPKDSSGAYTYYSYYKFGTLAMGFISGDDWEYPPYHTYGKNYLLPQFKRSGGNIKLKMDWRNPLAEDHWTTGSINNFIENSEWFGVEYYVKIGTPGQANGHATTWLYDQNGNATQIYDTTRMILPTSVEGIGNTSNHKFNKWFFGGNLSFKPEVVEQGLDTTYYVDDFIINDSRIGPSYFAQKFGGPPPPDTTPPSFTNAFPSGVLPSGTTSVNLTLNTDESATCKYSPTPGVNYSAMANSFLTTGGTSHSTSISGLQDGQTYNYYVRSQDTSGNVNTNDYIISFSVAVPDFKAPTVPTSLTSQAVSSAQINLAWSASTDNIGVTGYKLYRDGSQINTTSATTYQDTGLSPSTTYAYTVSAYDAAGNESSQSQSTSAITPVAPLIQTVISVGDTWKYFKGTSYPGSGWNNISFDDSSWLQGPTGIGYGDGDDATVLSDMKNNYLTVYARKTFNVSNESTVTGLSLNIDYDDGFVAYINGQEVARSKMPAGMPSYNTNASSHEAGIPKTFDLGSYTGNLVTGTNVLAIEIHNASLTSSDLSMAPELKIENTDGSVDTIPPIPPQGLTIK